MNSYPEPLRVTRKHPCTICGKADWCRYSRDSVIAFCSRVPHGSFKVNRAGEYLHRLIDNLPGAVRPSMPLDEPPMVQSALAPIEHRDAIFTRLMCSLKLKSEHMAALLTRGLDVAALRAAGYVSTPDEATAREMCNALAPDGLEGVPGFYRKAGHWRMVRTAPGYLIPIRDVRLRIQALAYRRAGWKQGDALGKYIWLSSKDKPDGVSSGAPLHFAKPHLMLNARELIITEGALKADVIAHLLNVPVLAASGVTTFGANFASNLKRDWPNIQPVVAFDSDFRSNDAVRGALQRLLEEMKEARFKPRIKVWPSHLGKGFDDYLLASARESEAT